jgi:membrane protein
MTNRGATQRAAARPRFVALLSRIWQVIVRTVGICFRHRATGLAAEAAFFAILSLPPLIFAVAGAIGFVTSQIDPDVIRQLREELLTLANQVLTPVVVESVIQPTLDDVLAGGRFDVISIGFLLSLWSGSRALNVCIDAIAIMYGHQGHRHFVRSRALAFLLYLIFMLVGVVLLPLVLVGPNIVHNLLPGPLEWLAALYWPIVLAGSGFFLAALYDLSLPRHYRLRAGFPGSAVVLLIWVGGSIALRWALGVSAETPSIYGPLAAPIALLLWLYLISLAVLIGAAINSAIDQSTPPEVTKKIESSEV